MIWLYPPSCLADFCRVRGRALVSRMGARHGLRQRDGTQPANEPGSLPQ